MEKKESGTRGKAHYKMYIDGEWCESESKEVFTVVSPASGETMATLPKGTADDMDRAVESAVEAQEKMKELSVAERVKLAYKTAELVGQNTTSYAKDLSLEHGKPYREAVAEVEDVIPNITWQAEDLKRHEAPALNSYGKPDMMYICQWEPLGTIGVITPWNFPWVLPSEFVVQAMIAGNSVVWKPASSTPISAAHFADCIVRAGWPKGAFQFVTGPGSVLGPALVSHPLIDGIGFTGETETGEDISRRAGVKKLALELGGLGPLIILDDANVDKAVEDIAFGCYTNTGHCCVANERILVHEAIHREMSRKLVERVKKIRLGFPLDKDTDMGPVQNEPTLKKVEAHVQDAVDRGARVLLGGQRARGFPTNLYYPPTVVDDVPPKAKFNNVETFGPVAPLIEFSDLDEAIEMANAPRYGLSMAVHTKNLKKALTVAQRVKTGQITINESVYYWDYHNPWGGFRKSGIGRIAGKWTLEAFQDLKTIVINVGRSDVK